VSSRADLSRTVVLVVALCLTVAATGAFARELRAADTQNEDYPTVQALRFMGRVISERSSGRHEIKVFHSRQLGEEKETLEQTRAGAIDLNRTNVALLGNIVPSMNVLAMPFLFRSIEHMQKVLDGPIGAESSRVSNPTASSGSRSTIRARDRSTTTSARCDRWQT
jgi:TRAP-type C4-dicarboxylate transport system substrate-binding protein